MRLSKHLTKTINSLLRVNYLRRQMRERQTAENIKSDIREFLRDVSCFKYEIVDKLPYYRIISEQGEEVMSEIEDMGVEFVEARRCIADVLKASDHGNYTGNSLTIDISQHLERHLKTMYELSRVNERMGFPMFQCFPLKRSFIPSFIPLDLGIVYIRRKYIATKGGSTRMLRDFGVVSSRRNIEFSNKPIKNIPGGCGRMGSHCAYCERRTG